MSKTCQSMLYDLLSSNIQIKNNDNYAYYYMKNIFTMKQCDNMNSIKELRKKYENELGNKTIEHMVKFEMSPSEKEKILTTIKDNTIKDENLIVNDLTTLNRMLYYGDKYPRELFNGKLVVT